MKYVRSEKLYFRYNRKYRHFGKKLFKLTPVISVCVLISRIFIFKVFHIQCEFLICTNIKTSYSWGQLVLNYFFRFGPNEKIQAIGNKHKFSIFSYILQTIRSDRMIFGTWQVFFEQAQFDENPLISQLWLLQ